MRDDFNCAWFEKYGGAEFWQPISEHFYSKLTTTPGLSKYFTRISPERVREIAEVMWQVALSLTGKWCEDAVARTHTDLLISEFDYETYISMLSSVLLEAGVEQGDVAELVERLRDFKPAICSG
jgi:truncated hemoglobin YjbI